MSLLERLPQAVRHEGGLSRRLFVAYGAALAALPALAARSAGTTDSKISFAADPFQLGVASGDRRPTASCSGRAFAPSHWNRAMA